MAYMPPFARMRHIKAIAKPRPTELRNAPVKQPEPASVEEALSNLKLPVIEPETAEVVEPEIIEVGAAAIVEPEIVVEEPIVEAEVEAEPAPSVPEYNMDLSRNQLNKIANDFGVELPEKLPSKRAVIEAIDHVLGK